MGLGRKNLVYSLVLAGIMMLFLLGYFIYMLPSLYVEYAMEQNLKSVRAQHEFYVRNGSYEKAIVRNSTACFSLEIPLEGECILISGKSFSAQVVIKDGQLYQAFENCREKLKSFRDLQQAEIQKDLEELAILLKETMQNDVSSPIELQMLSFGEGLEFHNESVKVHFYSDHMLILEASVEDFANRYTNYLVFEQREDRLIFTYLPVLTPDMNEIRPVVLRSIPMLGAVILWMVLIFSQVYSKGIVTPIVRLVGRAGEMKRRLVSMEEAGEVCKNKKKWEEEFASGTYGVGEDCGRAESGGRSHQNEIKELAATLEDFYEKIRENLWTLEEKNRELAEENQRQEIFLRASSHQLKTPIAAALLLVEGMANEVGRYKDTKVYLPKVKEQLLSMRKIVEDILYLNRCAENMYLQRMEPGHVIRERLRAFQIPIAEKEINIELTGDDGLAICTDEIMFSQICDNLLSNGVKYTPRGGLLQITIGRKEKKGEIRIENYGVTIPEALLPHIFEPFVSGADGKDRAGDSHGLGLYIVSYYARKLGISVGISNGENSVAVVLTADILKTF